MATRGGIVRITGNGTFEGRYHHWDAYPSGLGKTLWTLYRERHGKDMDKMLAELIDAHPAGWSTINHCDWSQTPGYSRGGELAKRPQCYCHGDRSEGEQVITEKDASAVGCEWIYGFRVEDGKDVMVVLAAYCGNGVQMIGTFGRGDPGALWHPVARIELDSDVLPEELK